MSAIMVWSSSNLEKGAGISSKFPHKMLMQSIFGLSLLCLCLARITHEEICSSKKQTFARKLLFQISFKGKGPVELLLVLLFTNKKFVNEKLPSDVLFQINESILPLNSTDFKVDNSLPCYVISTPELPFSSEGPRKQR